jgi:hypothetical protein
MQNQPQLIVTPAKVYRNETLTISWGTPNFDQRQYSISDEGGRVIRQGSVGEHISQFTLCMVGLATGVYYFTMGQEQVKFTIVY